MQSLPPRLVKEICEKFCYQEVCQGDSKWPTNDLLTDSIRSGIQVFCQDWRQKLARKASLSELSREPGPFVPFLLLLNGEYEQEHKDHKPYDARRLSLPRRFFPLPDPSVHWRSVSISVNALSCFIKESLPRGYQNQPDMFYRVFDFKKLRLSMDDLTPNGSNKILFGNIIKSDGFSVDFLFYRRKKERTNDGLDLELILEDFNYEEVLNQYDPMFLDPGSKSLFTAVVGVDSAKQIRKSSTKEYYHLTGSTVYSKNSRKKKKGSIDTIESQIPTTKTAKVEAYNQYIEYMLTHLEKLLEFYGEHIAHHRFQLYQGRQRAPEMMANMLTHGTAKYNKSQRKKKGKKNVKRGKKKKKKSKIGGSKENEGLKSKLDTTAKKLKWRPLPFREEKEKCPLVAFGDGAFGKDMVKLKNLRCGVVGKLFQTLKKREAAGALIVLTIDEFKTSKTCSSCFYSNLGAVKTTHFKGNPVLDCQHCNKVWQRDVNAATNVMKISKAVWMGEGRPEPFKREKINA